MFWFLVSIVVFAALILERAAIIAALGALWYFTTAQLWWPLHHPWQTLLYVAGYFVVGGVWSIVKWWFVETARFREAKDEFERRQFPRDQWAEFVAKRKTAVRVHTEDFAVWIAFWPFNLVWTVLDDPVRRLVKRIAAELRGVYQRITDYVWQ
jgi:hypothetical protein